MPYKDPQKAREAATERQRRYRERNPLTAEQKAAALERTRRWRAKDPEAYKASVQRWRDANPGADAARSRAAKLADMNSRFRNARNTAKRLAAKRGLPYEDFDIEALAVRDQWRCWICRCPIDRTVMDRNNPWNVSLDHVVPQSRGGGWTWDNLRLAHYGCNLLRGASTVEQARDFIRHFAAPDPDDREMLA